MCDGISCGPDPVCGADCGRCGSGVCFLGRCLGGSQDAGFGLDVGFGHDVGFGQDVGSPQDAGHSGSSSPRILSWALSSMELTPTRTINISAVVTDPDGLNDLVGGTLVDDQNRAYGTFANSTGAGSYSLSLSWPGSNQIDPITGAGLSRSLIARFFDVEGNMVEQRFSISLHCDDSGATPCSGICTSLDEDLHNCGACGFGCADPSTISSSADHCISGRCINNIPTFDATGGSTCAERCSLLGFVCDPSVGSPLGFANYGDHRCTTDLTNCQTPAPTMSFCSGSQMPRTWFQCDCWRNQPWHP